jgi:hypothetical protein
MVLTSAEIQWIEIKSRPIEHGHRLVFWRMLSATTETEFVSGFVIASRPKQSRRLDMVALWKEESLFKVSVENVICDAGDFDR